MEESNSGIKIKGVEKVQGETMDAADAIAKNMFNIALQLHDIKKIMSDQATFAHMIHNELQEIKLTGHGMTKALYELLGNEQIGRALESIIESNGGLNRNAE
jgi:hypothetical protein|tara:strand:- start:766 stop:1071 length:306 start_codon:yes stop_codon:yes gene_type:complete